MDVDPRADSQSPRERFAAALPVVSLIAPLSLIVPLSLALSSSSEDGAGHGVLLSAGLVIVAVAVVVAGSRRSPGAPQEPS